MIFKAMGEDSTLKNNYAKEVKTIYQRVFQNVEVQSENLGGDKDV